MRHKFCQNPLCDNPSSKRVKVSVRRPADQSRCLCATCEECFTWGEQHGRMSALAAVTDKTASLAKFLGKKAFVVLTFNKAEKHFEAWAYSGPLNFEQASPVVFGRGANIAEALEALNARLSTSPGRKRRGR